VVHAAESRRPRQASPRRRPALSPQGKEVREVGKFEFTLVIAGDVMSEEAINALFEAGCDDATFGGIDGSSFGGFEREAATPEQAAEAKLVAAINAALELRHAVGGLAPGQKDLVQALAARLPALIGVSEAEDGDVPWNHVPTDLAERLDRWAELLHEAWTLWR